MFKGYLNPVYKTKIQKIMINKFIFEK